MTDKWGGPKFDVEEVVQKVGSRDVKFTTDDGDLIFLSEWAEKVEGAEVFEPGQKWELSLKRVDE